MNVIEMHSSWLAINSIVGCPNGCKYCLLQATNDNKCFPKEIVTPKEAVKQLLEYKYYDKDIPVCLLPNTDVFVNPKNIRYLLDLLAELERQNVTNDLVIITKCNITDNVIEKVKELKQKGQNVIFYISYSGLGKDIEPRISEEILKNNFKKLKENDIDVIHYFRPFLPQNSDPKRIEEILDYVNQYTDISVTTGLALIETFIDKIECWNEVKKNKEACLKANCVWPESAWNYFNNNYSHKQQIFQTNTCGLNTKLKRPSTQYYGTEECLNYNHCSNEQRERCKLAHQKINENLIKANCTILLKKLGFDTTNVEFLFDRFGSLELKNIDLKISDASYLSYKLGIKVYVSTNKIVSNTYNSTLNGAKPLVLKVGDK
ncbi:MAG: radical SAM protein [Bacilli bacterium]